MDFIERIFTDFSEIHGDRAFGDDEAVACGMARLNGEEVLVIGNRKGGTTKERVKRNFGMPNPEGYRKALRAMRIAEKFSRPIISFIDLPGAYPGLGAEERGQAEAIARNIREMSRLRVPTISVISGEGGSGGALALAVSDRVLILENALYFVITPESCAAIMWRDANHKQLAAEAMRISAPEVAKLGCVDEIISEPPGGVHTDQEVGAGLAGHGARRASGRVESRCRSTNWWLHASRSSAISLSFIRKVRSWCGWRTRENRPQGLKPLANYAQSAARPKSLRFLHGSFPAAAVGRDIGGAASMTRLAFTTAGSARISQFVVAIIYYFLARSLAHPRAAGLASDRVGPLVEQAMLVFLLVLGYAAVGFSLNGQAQPISEQGLPRRAAGRARLGWAWRSDGAWLLFALR